MPAASCAAMGCTNHSRKLSNIKKQPCKKHTGQNKGKISFYFPHDYSKHYK